MRLNRLSGLDEQANYPIVRCLHCHKLLDDVDLVETIQADERHKYTHYVYKCDCGYSVGIIRGLK